MHSTAGNSSATLAGKPTSSCLLLGRKLGSAPHSGLPMLVGLSYKRPMPDRRLVLVPRYPQLDRATERHTKQVRFAGFVCEHRCSTGTYSRLACTLGSEPRCSSGIQM